MFKVEGDQGNYTKTKFSNKGKVKLTSGTFASKTWSNRKQI